MLSAMTADDGRLADLLDVYADHPLDDGDVVLVLDDQVCLEVEGLAEHWDPLVRRNTAKIVRETSTSVVVLIARPERTLIDRDYQLGRDLHTDLRDTDVQLHPVRGRPPT